MTLTNAELYRLKSDARRGLLENDLILQRFFERYGTQLTAEDGKVLTQLFSLEDNDLMDLLIGRKDFVEALERESQEQTAFKAVLQKLRQR
jgi:antitoxin CptB